ncbi:MAG: aldehyde dehydrogenase family protein, partial [Bacteroidota bacterium]
MSQITATIPDTSTLEQQFNTLKANQFKIGNTSASQRRQRLKKLHETILKYRPQVKEAMFQDFKKHPSEVDLTEVYPITHEIKHVRRRLGGWMRKQYVGTPLSMLGS